MEVAAPLTDAAASKVSNEVVDSVWRQIGYIWNYKTNIHDLEQQLQKLKAEKQSMLHRVEGVKRNGEEIEDIVNIWLKSADEAIEVAEEILKENDAANKSCFTGCCPNLKTRHQYSRKAKKETTVLAQIQLERNCINEVSYRSNVQYLEPLKDYEALESRMELLKEIIGALKSSENSLIGVYGLGGVGKTTLVKQQVIAQVKEEGIFKGVAVANVTHIWDLRKIQQEIAEWVGLKFDIDSTELRAARLRARLKQEEKVLVILDDLWEMIQLEKIGIPYKDDHKGCKVLMTSRDMNILSKMGVQRHFLLQVLPEVEAWQLFEKKAGDLENSELRCIAVEVARRCAGLPVLLVAVATSLRDKELFEWNDALEQLQKFDEKGMDAQVYSALELSFKFLGDDAKSLLILCAQEYGKIFISDLVKYAKGLDLFHKCITIKAVRNRLLKVVNDLKKSCFLLEGDNNEYVTMHDVVYSFAALTASKQHVFTLAHKSELDEWPEKDAFEQCCAISLPRCVIPELPEVLECPKLESFLLYNDDRLLKIPESFFSRTKKLKLVDLSDVNLLPKLPLSLGFLENLQTLCLDRCVLEDISAIGELNKLQVLSLYGSNIVQLPKEIKNLTRLQLLDLSECQRLEVIPPGILNCLVKLEELSMVGSIVQWEREGDIGNGKNASLSELKNLSNLINLEIHIMDAKIIPANLFHDKLERFTIFIGDDWDWYPENETSKSLKLKLNEGVELERVKVLLRRCKDLYLDDLKSVKNVVPKLDGHGFTDLKHLVVQNCDEMEVVVEEERMGDIIIFPSLESLSLLNLKKLKEIWYGQSASSFNNLKKLVVGNCNVLENLFSFSMFKFLIQLQEINVSQCEILKEIVDLRYEDEDAVKDETVKLTQLRRLSLKDLPKFAGFCSPTTNKTLGDISLVDEFEQLFNKKIQFPDLVELELSSIKVEKLWHHHSMEFCPSEKLSILILHGCESLASVFRSSMIRSLAQLQKIEICDCISIEEVISTDGETEEEMIFPKLNNLKLKGLPKVVKFCTSNSFLQCPSLKVLRVENCPCLQRFVSIGSGSGNEAEDYSTLLDKKVEFPNLEELKISGVHALKVIWGHEFYEDSFRKLKYLTIEDAQAVVKVFPPNLELRRFQNLESLNIHGCNALTEVFDIRAFMDVKKERGGVVITQLKTLSVDYAPNLTYIWNEDPKEIFDFQNLSSVEIIACPRLKSVFPASIAKCLVRLENIMITDSGMQELIAKDEGRIEGAAVFEFPKLKVLGLRRLSELERLYSGAHTSEWPALKELLITQCNKFQQPKLFYEKILPNLEHLSLGGREARMIREGQLTADLFHKLKDVEFNYFYEKSAVFPFDLLHIFRSLEVLIVSRCKFKELFPPDGLLVDEKHRMILTKIQSLSLYWLPDLKAIWNKVLQTLQFLLVLGCDSLIILAPSFASFQSLTDLDIYKCKGLVCLLTSSTAKSLAMLRNLRVNECNSMEVIISDEEDEAMDHEITFFNLEFLKLNCLSSLYCFCSANRRFKFPSLVEVVVEQCPKMEFFSKGVSTTPVLKSIYLTDEEKGDWLGNLNLTLTFLYKKMVGFRGMQHLKLSDFSNLKEKWHGELPVEFFCDLRSLVVDEGTFSSYAISSNLLECLNKLEELEVSNSEVFEEVFDLQGLSAKHGHHELLSMLERFHLINLPRMRHVWNDYPRGLLHFKHLKLLKVHNCSSLSMIFTPSMTRGLVQLQEMEVKNCTLLEEIITKGAEEAETDDIISFPRLNSLVLVYLPQLTSFHPRKDALQFISLEKVTVMDCPSIEVFASAVDEEQVPYKIDEGNPILFGKVRCPSLKELRVDWNNSIKNIWDGESIENEFFFHLKVLELKHCPTEYSIPSNLIERSPNLEELLLSDSSFEEIFLQENSSKKVTHLRRLTLSKLPMLRHLIKVKIELGSFNENLEDLQVLECSKLTILVPSSIPFQNLKTLKVSKCRGLLNLITSSTARSLSQLTRLEITECEMVEEITASEGGEVEAELGFSQLKHLELHCLPKLTSFCSGNDAFNFPILEQVIVKECPKMEFFVGGELSTPNLKCVQIGDENECCWDGSLNATIQRLFIETNAEKVED